MGWTIWSSNPGRGKKVFSSPKHSDRLSSLSSFVYKGHQGSLLGIKQPKCEVNCSPTGSADVKNEWSYTYTRSLSLMAWTQKTLSLPYFTFNVIICDNIM
jgi:hypothetical protein